MARTKSKVPFSYGVNKLIAEYLKEVDTETGLRRDEMLVAMMYNLARQGDQNAIRFLIERSGGSINNIKPYTDDEYLQNFDDYSYEVFKILNSLFEKQLDIINAGNGITIACTGRRAGKSYTAAALMLISCLKEPRTPCIYISETMKNGERILNNAMNEIIERCHLKDRSGNRLNWRHFDNESSIIIRGLSNTKDPDTIRGLKAKIIVIDEFFHLKTDLLAYLQHEVLEPMQLDYSGEYKELLIGTPPRIKGTYGEDIWVTAHEDPSKGMKWFKWTARDNPNIKNFDQYVAQRALEQGLDVQSPYIQREYYGEFMYDTDCMLFPVYHTWNKENVPQIKPTDIYVGIDYGVGDNNAIIGIAWDHNTNRGYVFWERKFNRLTILKTQTMVGVLKDDVSTLWEYAMDILLPTYGNNPVEANKHIVWAADTSDKQITEILKYDVHYRNTDIRMQIGDAFKYDMMTLYDVLSTILRKAELLIPEGGLTAKEMNMTVLKRAPNGEVMQEIDDKMFHPDLIPAMRYALARYVLKTYEFKDFTFANATS